MLKDWINQKHLKNISKLNKEFNTNKPFPHLEIDLFKESKIKQLLKEVKKLEFKEKNSDLFYLLQTVDFKSINNKLISEFYSIISSKEFYNILEKITGVKGLTATDAASLIFPNTGYLLPHDDRLSTRKIAYILNLSNFKEKDGGQLEFFETDPNNSPIKVAKSIIPKFNNFIIFKVSEKSFHQVNEVLTKQRITIGGWFNEQYTSKSY